MADPKIKYDIEANVQGSANVEQLASGIEKLSESLDGDLKKSALASAEALRQLGQKDGAIQTFIELKKKAQESAIGLKDAQEAAQKLGSELNGVQTPTRAQTGQLQKLRDAVRDAKTEVVANNAALISSRDGLAKYGLSTDNLGQSQRNVKTALANARTEVEGLTPVWKSAAAEAEASAKKQAQSAKQMGEGFKEVSSQIEGVKNAAIAFVGAQSLAGSVKDVAALADAWSNMKSRLQLALGAQVDVNAAMIDVEGVSKRTYTSLEATANLYGRIATAGREMGLGQQQALALTESINQSIQLSGASAQASEAAVTQLIQGFQSGVLRGDEFNSVMEQAPRLAKAMADGIGVPVGALRGMAEQGKLTSQTVIAALQAQAGAIGKEFTSLPVTIGRAVQNVQTEWQKFIGTMDSATGASGNVAAGIEAIGAHLDDLARVAGLAGAAMTASFAISAAQALRTAAVEMAATGGAAALLRRDLDTLSRPVNIAIAVTGFEIGFQIGEMLRENSSLARKFGVGLVGYFESLVSGLRLVKDAAAAVFTSDTVDAAYERFKTRNAQIKDSFSALIVEAEKSPALLAAAADSASAKTVSLGASAQAAGASVASAGAAGAAGVSKIGKAAEDARGALAGLAASINVAVPVNAGIEGIVRDLSAAKARAVDVELILRQQLPEAIGKLTGPELSKFRAEFITAMDSAGLKGRELKTGLGLIAEQAAKSLGVDVPAAFNTMSASFESARGNLSVLIRELPALKEAGVDTGAAVTQALANMINGAKNTAELQAVQQQVIVLRRELGDQVSNGLLDQAAKKAKELKDALDKATPGINSVREAMKQLGVTSDQTFKDAATQSNAAYDAMKASGLSSARELADGFKKMAADQMAASGAVGSTQRAVTEEILKSEGAARGLSVAFDASGKIIVQTQAEAAEAIAKTAGALGVQKDSVDKVTSALERQIEVQKKKLQIQADLDDLERKRLNIDKEGFSTDKSGNRIAAGGDLTTLTGISAFLKSAGVDDDAKARSIAREFADSKGNVTYMENPGQRKYGGDTISMALLKAAETYTFGTGNTGTGQQPSTIPLQSKTYTVNVVREGKTSAIGVTSEAAAQELISILQGAKLSSGY